MFRCNHNNHQLKFPPGWDIHNSLLHIYHSISTVSVPYLFPFFSIFPTWSPPNCLPNDYLFVLCLHLLCSHRNPIVMYVSDHTIVSII